MTLCCKIRHPSIACIFQNDASQTGWGIACTKDNTLQSQGLWRQEQTSLHINVKELYVVYILLLTFCKAMTDIHIRFELDDLTAMAYINHIGGSKSVACDRLAKRIWHWCISRNLWLSAVHFPGTTIAIVDSLSRTHSSHHEWQLNPVSFHKLHEIYLPFSTDHFASIYSKC